MVRRVAVAYLDFPIVEWALYLKDDGPNDSSILGMSCDGVIQTC